MAFPAALLFFVFHTFPALQGVFYSFTDSAGYGDWKFTGFDNYIQLFSDPVVINSYKFTIGIAIVCTILANIVSLVIALGLTSKYIKEHTYETYL
jgi:raffinose/stachyose/melibiose transport system permease protein